eukprot:1423767-Rhodomonas_salina.1
MAKSLVAGLYRCAELMMELFSSAPQFLDARELLSLFQQSVKQVQAILASKLSVFAQAEESGVRVPSELEHLFLAETMLLSRMKEKAWERASHLTDSWRSTEDSASAHTSLATDYEAFLSEIECLHTEYMKHGQAFVNKRNEARKESWNAELKRVERDYQTWEASYQAKLDDWRDRNVVYAEACSQFLDAARVFYDMLRVLLLHEKKDARCQTSAIKFFELIEKPIHSTVGAKLQEHKPEITCQEVVR